MSSARIITLLLALASVCINANEVDARLEAKHSFKSPFFMFRGYLPNWDFAGSAVITEDYVRLTPAVKSRTGSIWNLEAIQMNNWEVVIEFRIGGGGKLGADGMAFWYSPDFKQEGNVFGMRDMWHGLGIIFDTFDNDGMRDNPQIVAVLNDGTRSWQEDGKSIQYGGCHAQFRNPYKNMKIRVINYDNVVEIFVDTVGNGVWEPCVPATRLDLPTGYHFGLTAATGGLFDNHDVYAVETYNLDEPQEQQYEQYEHQQPESHEQEQQPEHHEQVPLDEQHHNSNNNQQPTFPPKHLGQNQPPQQNQQQLNQQQNQQQNQQNQQNQQGNQQDSTQNQPGQQGQQGQQNDVNSVLQRLRKINNQYDNQQQQQQQQQQDNNNNHQNDQGQSSGSNEIKDAMRSLSALNQKLDNLQQSVHSSSSNQGSSGTLNAIRDQLDQVKDQQAVFAEAFGNLLNSVATKSDLEAFRTRSESLFTQANKDAADLRALINDLKATVSSTRNNQQQDTTRTMIEAIHTTVNNLKHSIEATKESSRQIVDNLNKNQEDLTIKINKSSSFGFMTWFVIIQVILVFVGIWWKKHRDDANKKLF